MLTAFDSAIALRSEGADRFAATIDEGWFGGAGPHGGYLAAIGLNAMTEVIGADRPIRALTCHFLHGAQGGTAEVTVRVLRTGRTVASAEATLSQDGRARMIASGTFVTGTDSVRSRTAATMPQGLTAFDGSPALALPALPSLFDRLDQRVAAPEVAGSDRRLGWVRFHERRQVDAVALALFADCWVPALAAGTSEVPMAPTLDFMVLFRGSAAADEPVLLDIRTAQTHDGIADESVDIWSADGRLLAQSRQLLLDR